MQRLYQLFVLYKWTVKSHIDIVSTYIKIC